jgi:hypothetical protein
MGMKSRWGPSRPMPKKKSRFSAVKEVKAMARERIGNPPAERVVPDKTKKKSTVKHKPTLERLIAETD